MDTVSEHGRGGAFENTETLLRNEVQMLSDILDLNSGQQRPGSYYLT